MVRLLIAALVIPLGLDLYMPVPEDNPITTEKIELGRRLFNDRRLSRDAPSRVRRVTSRNMRSPNPRRFRQACSGGAGGAMRRR
jgi:hypothetical protein